MKEPIIILLGMSLKCLSWEKSTKKLKMLRFKRFSSHRNLLKKCKLNKRQQKILKKLNQSLKKNSLNLLQKHLKNLKKLQNRNLIIKLLRLTVKSFKMAWTIKKLTTNFLLSKKKATFSLRRKLLKKQSNYSVKESSFMRILAVQRVRQISKQWSLKYTLTEPFHSTCSINNLVLSQMLVMCFKI